MKYIFKIVIPFEATDDPEAREIALAIKKDYDESFSIEGEEITLQKVYNDKPPVKIKID